MHRKNVFDDQSSISHLEFSFLAQPLVKGNEDVGYKGGPKFFFF